MNRRFIYICLVIASLGGLIWYVAHTPTQNQPRALINRHLFSITVANTTQEQERGLSGVTHLELDSGMYFPLDTNQPTPSFWMKNMLIPIDILWLKGGKVVGINANVPMQPPGTSDDQLPTYKTPIPQPDGVLEIAANRAQQLHIQVGDSAIIISK
jgi:uncharacterized membrane protein (UPF0127 family)